MVGVFIEQFKMWMVKTPIAGKKLFVYINSNSPPKTSPNAQSVFLRKK
jgi:hypothetical protein